MAMKVVNYGTRGPRGPEGPALGQRVSDLESALAQIVMKMDRVAAALQRLEPGIRGIASKFSDLNARVASLAMPTFLQLVVALISTWAAGTAIVFALLKATNSMTSSFRTLDDADVSGKRVLLRVDLNVPTENGRRHRCDLHRARRADHRGDRRQGRQGHPACAFRPSQGRPGRGQFA